MQLFVDGVKCNNTGLREVVEVVAFAAACIVLAKFHYAI